MPERENRPVITYKENRKVLLFIILVKSIKPEILRKILEEERKRMYNKRRRKKKNDEGTTTTAAASSLSIMLLMLLRTESKAEIKFENELNSYYYLC